MAEQRLSNLLPAPDIGGVREYTGLLSLAYSTTGYTTYADFSNTAAIRKDYLVSYVATQFALKTPYTVYGSTGINAYSVTLNNQRNNFVNATYAGILSGDSHRINSGANYGVIVAGLANAINGTQGTIVNGTYNIVAGSQGFIGNGAQNQITVNGGYGVVLNGSSNTVAGYFGTIINGSSNQALGTLNYIQNGGSNIIQNGSTKCSIENSNSCTISSGCTNVTVMNSDNFVTPNNISNKFYFAGRDIQLPSATPAAVKNAVTNTNNTWASGELQGSQPSGSFPGMKFCDQNYAYDYRNGYLDTDGTSYVWVRLVKNIPV